jgi:hypothetical protein
VEPASLFIETSLPGQSQWMQHIQTSEFLGKDVPLKKRISSAIFVITAAPRLHQARNFELWLNPS